MSLYKSLHLMMWQLIYYLGIFFSSSRRCVLGMQGDDGERLSTLPKAVTLYNDD